jgi:endonuclease I
MKLFWLAALAWLGSLDTQAQGIETFNNMPATGSGYGDRNWTGDNGLTWTATDARTDQTINGKAIGLRIGALKCNGIPNGIGTLRFSYKYLFTAGGDARIVVRVNGDSIDQVIVPTTAIDNQVSPVFTINRTGSINLELAQANPAVSSGPRVAIDDVTWTPFNGTACATPATQAFGLTFGSATTSSISGSFSPAFTGADKYLVLRSTASSLAQLPANGIGYTEDDVLGNATVVSAQAGTNFVANGLAGSTTYHFFVCAFNDLCTGGPLYSLLAPATGSATTATPLACVAPLAGATALSFSSVGNTAIGGSFTPSATADSYLGVVSTGSTLAFAPANGTAYTEGQTVGNGRVVKLGGGNTFSATGLVANTLYYLYIFAYNNAGCTGGPLYNTTVLTGSATTTNAPNNIPPGYYASITNQTCAALKTALSTIVSNGMTPRDYGSLPNQYAITDIKPREVGTGSASVIWDIYSDVPGPNNDPYNYSIDQRTCGGEGAGWNREHSVPQSWFTGGTSTGPGTDYHHIFPTDCAVNSARGSFIYGEVGAANYTSQNGSKKGSSAIAGFSGEVFEPLNEYKGDVARAFLYFVTRYESSMPGWSGGSNGAQAMDPSTFPSVDVPYLRLMLKWHQQDPVSEKEMVRNNGGYDFQRNRNPYVDHPEYVDLVWNSNCSGLGALPVDVIAFGGKLEGNGLRLYWKVANEQNLRTYVVERSINGQQYTRIGEQLATGASQYHFTDPVASLAGWRLYYRLRVVDRDGSFRFSPIFSLHTPKNTLFSVFPNPVTNGPLQILLHAPVRNGSLQLLDLAGRAVVSQSINGSSSTIGLWLGHLPAGAYLLQVRTQDGTEQTRIQIVK